MIPVGRRAIAIVLGLAVLACGLSALGVFAWLRGGSAMPWRQSLSAGQMEALLESQTITSVTVHAAIQPAAGRIDGDAALTVARAGSGGQVVLLLNPGLEVSRVSWNESPVSWRRQGARILVEAPEESGEGLLAIRYGGVMEPANDSVLLMDQDTVLIDRLQWWYPLDLKNFPEFEASVQVPAALDVAWTGALAENQAEGGIRTVTWKESRPVLAVGLAAGRFEKTARLQGGVRCGVFQRPGANVDAGPLLAALGDAYNYFQTVWGPNGFEQLNLVLAEQERAAVHVGGPTIVAHPGSLDDPDEVFALLADQVARTWWGDTISGRWFTARPEAGEWLLSGLSEYGAWQALRNVKGRRAYLRHMEQREPPSAPRDAAKTVNLDRRLQADPRGPSNRRDTRGAYAAAAIASYIGQNAFDQACRNFMAVHRYSTVSYAALLHEMTLASERPLDELVRVWFDRPGAFDYGIAAVATETNRVHITIENTGDIPAFVPIALGVLGETEYQVHAIEPGAHGGTFSFTFEGRLNRVVLDPEFALGDARRANNIWPQTQWPVAVDVSRNGRIAMLADIGWGNSGEQYLYIFSLVDKSPALALAMPRGDTAGFQWHRDGQQLLVHNGRGGVLRGDQWDPVPAGAVPLGWSGDSPVYWRNGHIETPDAPESDSTGEAPAPRAGAAAVHPGSGDIAYVTDAGAIVRWNAAAGQIETVRDSANLAGSLRWIEESRRLIYFEADGALVALEADNGSRSVLVQRSYPIRQSRLSARGTCAAWVDPAGLLRAYRQGQDPVYISLPGEVVDFAWEGEDALIAIVATVPRRIPMRFHAEYTLWRIPASTWTAIQLPYNATQFAQAAKEIPTITPE